MVRRRARGVVAGDSELLLARRNVRIRLEMALLLLNRRKLGVRRVHAVGLLRIGDPKR